MRETRLPAGTLRPLAVLLLSVAILTSGAVAAEPPSASVTVTGEPATVFRKATDACDAGDIPDAPARAIRDASGRVRLFATHWVNRSFTGPDLLSLTPDCRVAFRGGDDPDPARFDDRLWLASPWTEDGRRVLALVHGEYQGHRHPGRCPSGRYMDCWWNAISLAVSADGGATFTRPAGGPAVVAALPYRYDPQARRHVGLFNPTGLVSEGGALHALAFTEGYREQRRGNCLLRAENPWSAASWRAWDGTAFAARMPDPYAGEPDPERQRCAPVAPGALRWPATALLRHAPSGAYLALMQGGGAVWVSASRDLLRWSEPTRVMDALGHGAWRCGDPAPLAYPSLLDPASPSRAFETVGDAALLFATRFVPTPDCRLGMERDLIRLRVRVTLR